MRVDSSTAPAEFANDIEAYLGFIGLERGLARNTSAGYRRDLDQAAVFFARRGAANWRAVSGDHAAAWIHSLSAAKYSVAFDGARIVMTVLSSRLDLGSLAAAAARCEHFETFFDTRSPGIPITTTTLPSGPDALAYEQTMQLGGSTNSFYMSFANAGGMGVFGAAFPTKNPTISVKGTLPQTFLDTAQRQAARIAAS